MTMVNPYYLGIDTSCGWTSLGLVNEDRVVDSSTASAREIRAQGFVPRVRRFLEGARVRPEDLTGIGVVVGPGSFTALRVGVASAQGLAMGLGVPLVPVETHAAAIRSISSVVAPVLVVVPARKGEVFAQAFNHQPGIGWVSMGMIECLKVEELLRIWASPALIAGPALGAYGEEIAALYGDRIPLAPQTSWTIRGESVASIARERLLDGGTDFDPGQTAIRYLQSHGALTIEERVKAGTEKR